MPKTKDFSLKKSQNLTISRILPNHIYPESVRQTLFLQIVLF